MGAYARTTITNVFRAVYSIITFRRGGTGVVSTYDVVTFIAGSTGRCIGACTCCARSLTTTVGGAFWTAGAQPAAALVIHRAVVAVITAAGIVDAGFPFAVATRPGACACAISGIGSWNPTQ